MRELDLVTPAGAARIAGLSRNAIGNNVKNGALTGVWADDGDGGSRLVGITRRELRRYIRAREDAKAAGGSYAKSAGLRSG